MDMVGLEPLVDEDDIREVQTLIEKHIVYTGSEIATRIMTSWETQISHFVKVMPRDYKRVLLERKANAQVRAEELVTS